MKAQDYLSLLCIILGIAMCAAFGSRLTSATFDRQAVAVHVKKLTELTKSAHKEARSYQDQVSESRGAAPSTSVEFEKLQSQLLKAKTQFENLSERLREAQGRLPSRQPPRDRLSAWWSLAGWPFVTGCCLILIGAFMARRGVQTQEVGSDTGGGALDLGAALTHLYDAVDQLRSRLRSLSSDDMVQIEALRGELLGLQQDQVVPIVESRSRAQVSLGLARYAEIFGLISQGERRLNRAWAALVDGHLAEANRSLEGAVNAWRQAVEELNAAG